MSTKMFLSPKEKFFVLLQHDLNLLCGGEAVTVFVKPERSKIDLLESGAVRRITKVVFDVSPQQQLDPEMVRIAVVRTLVVVGTTVWCDGSYKNFFVGSQGRPIGVRQTMIDGVTFVGEIVGLEVPAGIHWQDGQPVDERVGSRGVLRQLAEEEIFEARKPA